LEEQNNVYWHDAYYEAIQLELHQYSDYLDFTHEFPLSKEALKIDVLIIKKQPGKHINKNIGRIFKAHNLVEFKSETDSLSRHDYNKVMGYAFLYSAFNQIDESEITITLSVTIHPKALLTHLTTNRGLVVREVESGIYYIEGEAFPIQIIESKLLSSEENLFMRNLRSNLSAEDVAKTAEAYRKLKPLDMRNAYLDRVVQANRKTFLEVMDMSEAVKELFYEAGNKYGWFKDRDNHSAYEKAKRIAVKMLLAGEPIEKVAEMTELSYDTVAGLV